MTFKSKLRHVRWIAALLLRSPEQTRFLHAWAKALRSTTTDSRLPWLPFSVIEVLADRITPESRVFEFGGGGSTLWFASRAKEVVTVEHDRQWFELVARAVADRPDCRVVYATDREQYAAYVSVIRAYPDGYFDVVVVDGRERLRCFDAAMPKVRRGGLLVLDDSERERYAGAFQLAAGWPHRTFRGLAPSKAVPATTTLWTRP
jgi:predicted O-methyltransferase YrrM